MFRSLSSWIAVFSFMILCSSEYDIQTFSSQYSTIFCLTVLQRNWLYICTQVNARRSGYPTNKTQNYRYFWGSIQYRLDDLENDWCRGATIRAEKMDILFREYWLSDFCGFSASYNQYLAEDHNAVYLSLLFDLE